MIKQAAAFDAEGELPDDVAFVTSTAETHHEPPDQDVMHAIRYLLYRYELSTGSAQLPQLIAVVSSSAGEGVTTVSRALAELLASEKSSRVCWIDFGGASSSPPAATRLDRPELPGIPNVLHDVSSTEPLLRPGTAPVRLLSAGSLPSAQLSAMSGRPELDDLISGLAREYRYVVFDTPPLMSRTDSIGFLRHADAYILVARHGSTTLNQVRAMADELRTVPSLGAILNDYRTKTPRFIRRFFSE